MDTQEAIQLRRTTHSFGPKMVPEELVINAVEAGNQAPCHHRTYPWRFTLVSKIKRQELIKYALDELKRRGSQTESEISKFQTKILTPSHLLVASQVLSKNEERISEDYAACCCAIQNISLSLTANQVGSKWSTGWITKSDNTYKALEIDPINERIIGFIWIGFGEPLQPINRPSLDQVLRRI